MVPDSVSIQPTLFGCDEVIFMGKHVGYITQHRGSWFSFQDPDAVWSNRFEHRTLCDAVILLCQKHLLERSASGRV